MAIGMKILLLLLVINAAAFARREDEQQRHEHRRQRERHQRMFEDLKPQEPRVELESDGGKLEVWGGRGSGVFEDANVAACRTTLKRRGLWLPSYIDAPSMQLVTRGGGRVGVISSRGDRRSQETTFKVEKGDVVAVPQGVVVWWYNDQDRDLEIVGLADVTESTRPASLRAFHLAGGKQEGQQRKEEERRRGREEEEDQRRRGREEEEEQRRQRREDQRREDQRREDQRGERSEQSGYGAVIHGFSTEVLSRAWQMDKSTVKELLQSQSEMGIIRLDKDITFPDQEERDNTFYQNFIYRFGKTNPDIRVRDGGELRELNSYKLPVLKQLGLGMECVQLEQDAMVSPNWFRAHQILYVMEGRGKIEAVSNDGERALDTDLEKGSLVVIPAFFPSTKIAGSEGFHYVSFLTTDKPMISYMSGRNSVYQGIPLRVLSRILNVDEERAKQVQRAHERESVIFPSESSAARRRDGQRDPRRREDEKRRHEEEDESRRRQREEKRREEEEEDRRRKRESEDESKRRGAWAL
ncbi:11S globulin seed storage protein 2 [Selaginella moellendorffii]|uniref:11S globulin seed storage protein 2 n=1 Tax=Selaginella moellendorffii TaxID=88036 RepID=UPI000D1C9BD2|nr:11S globulin seed storage protein 2 [Selaginella moellendorffii]|eukprot:XP_024517780.1 11S globulin seed storage protein 2 [Selaginella moellendorffii]